MMTIAPQEGPQTMFMTSPADIVIYGGAAGGGKTFSLLLEPLRHVSNSGFGAVIFRSEFAQIMNEGGLWDASKKLYNNVAGAYPKMSPREHWEFPSGAKVTFSYLSRKDDCERWQGTEICLIEFDELCHFTEYMFFYMLSRNRSTCGVKPYVRASCNPDADSWVANFISWWIDQDTGYPIPERSGKLRWMVRIDEKITWYNSREEAVAGAIAHGIAERKAKTLPKSVTFIASTLEDNKILMETDPGYVANLEALAQVERERLLHGNWKIKAAAGLFFKRTQVANFITELPSDIAFMVRGWDLAATDEDEGGDPAYTAGVLMAKTYSGRFIVVDVINQRLKAGDVKKLIYNTAVLDKAKYGYVRTRLPQDPGQAGKAQALDFINMLSGFDVKAEAESGDKISRATPMAAQWQNGFFDMVIGEWNEMYLNQLESFPESKFKDMVDAGSSAFAELNTETSFNIYNML